MKTNKLIAAALLPLLFSCAKENLNQIDKPENADDYITVSLVPGEDAVTRASFDDNDGIFWQQGGFAGLVNANANNIKSLALDKTYLYHGNNQASFKFTKSELTDKPGPYVLYYPHHDAVKVIDGKYKIPFTIRVTQETEIGKSTEIFSVVSKNAIDLVPYQEDTNYDNNGAEVYFKVVGSYIRILPYGGTKEGEVIDYIKIYDINNNHISGDYFVSVEVTGAENKPTTIALADGTDRTSNEMYVNFAEKPSTNIEKTAAKGIYAQVLPGKHQLAYEIHTKNGHTYTFKSSKETDFAFGSIKDVPLNIQKATQVSALPVPEELYLVGDVTYVGWNHQNAKKMTRNGDVFTFDAYLSTKVKQSDNSIKDPAEGFKFLLQTSGWEPSYVNGGDNTLAYYNGEDSNKDNKFKVDKSGYYTVTADFSTGKVTCTPKAPEKLYVWGSATAAGWTSENAISLDRDENDNFVFTKKDITLKVGEYKFFSENHEMTAYVSDDNGNLVYFDSPSGSSDADKKFKVAYAGTYDLTVNLRDNTVKCILKTIPEARVKTGAWTKMVQTEPGVFIAKDWWIKRGDNNHDIQIRCGETQYINSGNYQQITFDSRESSLNGKTFEVSASTNAEYSWWINNDWCEVRYDIIFDSNQNKVTIKYAPAKMLYLIGHINNWTIRDNNYKADVGEDGIAKWIIVAPGPYYDNNGNEIYGTDIKIHGEYLYENVFDSAGEWYYSDGSDGNNVTVTDGGTFDIKPFNYDYKWYFGYGNYTVEFNTHTFKLTVTKNNSSNKMAF